MIAFTPDNFLPRGATMQGTGAKGILALVLYTGNDTKLVLNQGKYKYKTSNTEINLNIIFAAQIAQMIFFSVLFTLLQANFLSNNRHLEYLYEGIESESVYSASIFGSFWIIMTRYVPFDLILQSETGKIIYSKFLEWDTRMMHADGETGQILHCKVQSMQLPEQLGEVDHMFCDKTGTLTQNDLDVKALCVGSIVCRGETREELNQDVESKCLHEETVQHLYRCFCLCNDLRVLFNPQKGTVRYDGSS